MRIERRFTKEGQSAYAEIEFRKATSEIRNPDGSIVFRLEDIDVPVAVQPGGSRHPGAEIFPQGRRARALKKVEENSVPSWLWRSVADEEALAELPEDERYGSETDARQVFDRLAGTWTYWGWKGGYFDLRRRRPRLHRRAGLHARHPARRAELPAMVQHRPALGLRHRRPRPGPLLCRPLHRQADQVRNRPTSTRSRMPASSSRSSDDLVNDGGIMDLWVREARLFKYGSGTGSNFSHLRGEGEKLSGGGKSSGLMSFLKIGDRAAGAIKSGGTTRRAAKMVVVDIDHPDIEDYIDWKVKEEQKVAALVTGSKIVKKHLTAIMKACVNCEADNDDCFDPKQEPSAQARDQGRQEGQVPENYIKRVIQFARRATPRSSSRPTTPTGIRKPTCTVSGQNSNNSVSSRTTSCARSRADGEWNLTARKDGKVAKTVKARDLWEQIGHAAWAAPIRACTSTPP
jgi:ribonucleoside-diphosphate reductase alpha chain